MGRRKILGARFCSVRGCPNFGRTFRKSGNVYNIPIFKCPAPNSPMLKKWLKALKIKDYDCRIHICIRHFKEDCIIREKTVVNHDGSKSIVPLKKPIVSRNAVPTIFDEMTTKLGPHCSLVRMWRGGHRKYADTSIQELCSVTLQTEPRDGVAGWAGEDAHDETKLVKAPTFIKSEVPDPELDWFNEDPENCKIKNTFVKQDIDIVNSVIVKQEVDLDDDCQKLVGSEVVVGSRKQKRKSIQGTPVGPDVKKPRAKELFYPCPICHSLIQRRRQMINHMQRRHPDHELTKRVQKEREVNPRGHYRSLSPYLSFAIKAPDGFDDYPSKCDVESLCPPILDSSHPLGPSLSPTPDCEDPLAGEPTSSEPPSSPPLSICSQFPKSAPCILLEHVFDDAPPVPRTSTMSTPVIPPHLSTIVSEPCDSKSKCLLSLPPPPPLLPIGVVSYPTSSVKQIYKRKKWHVTPKARARVSSPTPPATDSACSADLSHPPFCDQEATALANSVIYSSWDLSVFKVHLYNIPMEKKEFLKKRLMEVVEAVTVRDLDPERIIIAYCDRSSVKSQQL